MIIICPNCGNTDEIWMDVVGHCKICATKEIHAHTVCKYTGITKENILQKLYEKEANYHGLSDNSYLVTRGFRKTEKSYFKIQCSNCLHKGKEKFTKEEIKELPKKLTCSECENETHMIIKN